MELAKSLEAADKYVPLSRKDPAPQWAKLKEDNPYGFDIGESSCCGGCANRGYVEGVLTA